MIKENSARLQSSTFQKKRNDIDIMADILKKAKKGAGKTRLMYYCNLSFSQIESYLNFLLEIELIAIHPAEQKNRKSYQTTIRGLKFLDTYSQLKMLMT